MSIAMRLKVMSFLQYFIWGSWLVTLGSYMINTLHFTGANVGMVYSSKGIAAIIMPGIMGIIADKWPCWNAANLMPGSGEWRQNHRLVLPAYGCMNRRFWWRCLKSIISHHFPPSRWKRYVTSILLQCRPFTLTGIFCSEFASRWDFHRLLFAKLMNRKRYSLWSVWALVSH